MKKILTLLLLTYASSAFSQTLYFPPLTGNTWDTLTDQERGWCADSLQRLVDYVGDNNSKAFIILKDGKIALEKYYGTFTKDSLWYWASAGKSLTGFMVGMAQEEGLLDINTSSSMFLGTGWTVAPPEKENLITIRNQLTMTSGLNDAVESPDCTIDTCLEYLADAGTRWAYHNAPYTLLDGIISGASGSTINQFYSSRVRGRLGMGVSAYIASGDNNVMFSTARAMARFGLMVLNRGVWNQDTLMHDMGYFDAMTNTSQSINPSYGYLWWLNGKSSYKLPGSQISFPGSLMPDAPNDMFSALGKNNQYINIVPSLNIVLIRMGNDPSGLSGLVPTILDNEIWRRLSGIICEIPTALNEITPVTFQVFPNPANDHFTIQVGKTDMLLGVELCDMQGRIVAHSTQANLNVSHLASGMYVIRVKTHSGMAVQKVLIGK